MSADDQVIRPGHCRARRFHDRFSNVLPKRTINYDLAESFLDHSTNPLSSHLYKIRFKHSAKQWPNGRFCNYEDERIACTRTYPLVPKRKKIVEEEKKKNDEPMVVVVVDPIVQEQKKKLADEQTNLYANLFASNRVNLNEDLPPHSFFSLVLRNSSTKDQSLIKMLFLPNDRHFNIIVKMSLVSE